MPIYLGNSKIQDLYVGGTKIKEAYYGPTLVYSSSFDEYWLRVEFAETNRIDDLCFDQMYVNGSRPTLISGRTSNNGSSWTSISNSDLLKATGSTSGGINFYTHICEFRLNINTKPSSVGWRDNQWYSTPHDIVGTLFGVRNSQRISLGTVTCIQQTGKVFTITL